MLFLPLPPDQKFCVKCKMVLTYDAYSEAIEEKQIKDKWERSKLMPEKEVYPIRNCAGGGDPIFFG